MRTGLTPQVKSQQPQARSLAAEMATELLSDLLGSRSDVAADVVDYLRSTKVKGINKDLWQSIWSFVRCACVRAHVDSAVSRDQARRQSRPDRL